jgi:hypothetical protein
MFMRQNVKKLSQFRLQQAGRDRNAKLWFSRKALATEIEKRKPPNGTTGDGSLAMTQRAQ